MRQSSPLIAVTLLSIFVPVTSAGAQSLNVFGGWGDDNVSGYERQHRAPQSAPKAFGGAPRAGENARPNAYGGSSFGFNAGPGKSFPAIMEGGGRPAIAGRAPAIVPFYSSEKPGTILIDNSKRRLFFVLDSDEAYEYPISVGRDGFTWTGVETVSRIADWPDWHPPAEMRQRDPRLPEKMYGGIKNPLGVKALFLGNTLYRIHGTNDPKTIGYAASSGCFRMMNEHVVHLAALVAEGTVVKVMDRIDEPPQVAGKPWQAKPAALGGTRRDETVSGQYYDDQSDVWIAR